MLKPIRKTLTGRVEYWDTEKKLVVMGSVDSTNETIIDDEKTIDDETDINLDEMNAEQLRSFAEQNGIDVPGNMKKEETIRNYIAEQLTAADAE